MKILGIDPGTARVGYGLIERARGLRLLSCGLIDGEKQSAAQRLKLIEQRVRELIQDNRPDFVCLEKLFFAKNQKTALSVSEARGVVLLVVAKEGIPLLEFSPSEIKSIVAGDGRASKAGVKHAVSLTLNEPLIPGPDDVSDALAVAICGAFDLSTRRS